MSISSSLSLARKLKSIFGDRFYCEIMPHKFRQQVIANNRACAAATILKINLVTTFDVHYLRAEESKYHDLLMEIQGRDPYTSKEFWFRNKGQVLEYIRLWPERFQRSFIDGAKSTVEIADRCDFEIVFGNFSFPKFEVTLDEGFLKWLEQKNT